MSNRAFERSLARITILVIIWMVCSAVFLGLYWFWSVAVELMIELGQGGYLSYIWGKNFMKRIGGCISIQIEFSHSQLLTSPTGLNS